MSLEQPQGNILIPQQRRMVTIGSEFANISIGGEIIDKYNKHLTYMGYMVVFDRERARLMKEKKAGLDELDKNHGLKAYMTGYQVEHSGEVYVGEDIDVLTTVYNRLATVSFSQQMEKEGKVVADSNWIYRVIGERKKISLMMQELIQRLSPSIL